VIERGGTHILVSTQGESQVKSPKEASGQRTLTSWGAQTEVQVRSLKGSERARDTHFLGVAEEGISRKKAWGQGILTF
jgi:hypothetical protein